MVSLAIEEIKIITLTDGNLLEAETEALVNTVNCVGHMGKGVALQFKKAFPDNYSAYREECDNEKMKPGRMFTYEIDNLMNPRYIINFPTKRHWREGSHYEDIKSGLKALIRDIRKRKIKSVAMPALGCGYGGLDWKRVQKMIETAFEELPDVEVLLFPPDAYADAKDRSVGVGSPQK